MDKPTAKPHITANPRRSTARTGAAPHIRALKERFPEMGPTAIAKRVGCSTGTVSAVLKLYSQGISTQELKDFQDNRAQVFDVITHRALLSITPEKLANAKPVELATVAGIMYDKRRLEQGLASSINLSVLWDVVEAIRERRAAPAGGAGGVIDGKTPIS